MSATLIALNDGNKIPALGLGRSIFAIPPPGCTLTVRTLNRLGFGSIGAGTWLSKPDEVVNAVAHALKSGYMPVWGTAV